TQVVITADAGAELHKKAESLRSEFVVAVVGRVKLRDANTVNKNIPTGEIEVVADELRILNVCKPLPFAPPTTKSPTKRCASSIAISTSAGPRCSTTFNCATTCRSR